jgi:PAS domain S-box-containing protein
MVHQLRVLVIGGTSEAEEKVMDALRKGGIDAQIERTSDPPSASESRAVHRPEGEVDPGEILFRDLAENIQEVLWLADSDLRTITYVNRAYESIWGRPARNLQEDPMDWVQAVHPDDRARVEEACFRKADSAGCEQEYRIVRPDGNVRWIRHRQIPIRDREGRIRRVAGLSEDISERRRLQDDHDRLLVREQYARDQAEAASRAKDKFLASLSHELLAPLTPVLAASDLLRRSGNLSPDTRNLPDMIRKNIELELRLINDLLDLTRITADKQELNLLVVDVHMLLGNVLKIYQGDIRTKHLRLKISPEAEEHHVRADRSRLLRVFWNLIGNAVKYTPAGGDITVSTRNPKPGAIAIGVTDGGIDVEPGMLDRLFQAMESTERPMAFGELGLGLSISRTVVELHGGSMTATPRTGAEGSCFTVELSTVPASLAGEAARPARREPLTILLVENNRETLYVLERLLKTFGHNVLTASSAESALDLARANRFDLLISDIGLPDRSGWELMHQLRRMAPVRGIALSGFGSPEDAKKSVESGFSAHLTKPVNVAKLEELIEQTVSD